MSDVGRPTSMTEETLNKLEYVFGIGGTDEEACFYANISPKTLYNYQNKNEEFLHRKEALKSNPILKARETVFKELDKSYNNAMDYLKRKKKDEFSERTELTGKDGGDLKVNVINYGDSNTLPLPTENIPDTTPESN